MKPLAIFLTIPLFLAGCNGGGSHSVAGKTYSKAVQHGQKTVVSHHYDLNPDCTPTGDMTVVTKIPPQHGQLDIHKAMFSPGYDPNNIHRSCNSRQVPTVEVAYTANADYLGPDDFVLEVIFPSGVAGQMKYNVMVR